MGRVYRAEDTRSGRKGALTFLSETIARNRSRWFQADPSVLKFPVHLVEDLPIDDGHESLQV